MGSTSPGRPCSRSGSAPTARFKIRGEFVMRRSPVQMIALTMMLGASGVALAQGTFRRTDTGIVVTPAQGPEAAVRLQVYGDGIIRVTSAPTRDLDLPASLM